MNQVTVDSMLKGYKCARGRCGHLAAEMELLSRQIKVAENSRASDLAAIRPQQLTDMPHGTQVGNPTEKFGLMLASGWESEELKDLLEQYAKIKAQHSNLEITVSFVESWLSGLTERERWVVEQQIIEGRFWRDIQTDYRKRFEEICSKDTLKRLRARAMEKIYKMAE